MLELALFSTTLFLLLFGVADFARIFRASLIATGAARAGAQFGLLGPGDSADLLGMEQAAKNNASGDKGLKATAVRYCQCSGSIERVSCTASCRVGKAPNGYIQVDTELPFDMLIHWPTLPGSTRLKGQAILRVY